MNSDDRLLVFACSVPVKVVSEANQREHHMAKHRRKKDQQKVTLLVLQSKHASGASFAARTVWLTRVIANRGKSMDADNLAGSFKHVQDAVAKWLGIDDGKLRWAYFQVRGHAPAVNIEIF